MVLRKGCFLLLPSLYTAYSHQILLPTTVNGDPDVIYLPDHLEFISLDSPIYITNTCMMGNMQTIDLFELQQSQINDMIKKGKNGLTFN
jgi:hypothetical protein